MFCGYLCPFRWLQELPNIVGICQKVSQQHITSVLSPGGQGEAAFALETRPSLKKTVKLDIFMASQY